MNRGPEVRLHIAYIVFYGAGIVFCIDTLLSNSKWSPILLIIVYFILALSCFIVGYSIGQIHKILKNKKP